MGLFDGLKDSLIQRALAPHLGDNFVIKGKYAGKLTIDLKQIYRIPIYAVSTDKGMFFINRGEVVFGFPWGALIFGKEDELYSWPRVLMIASGDVNQSSFGPTKTEYPYSTWTRIELDLNDKNSLSELQEIFNENLGFSKLSLEEQKFRTNLLEVWLQEYLSLPVTKDVWDSQFKPDTDSELINKTYQMLGEVSDAKRILLYIGRQVVYGTFSTDLLVKSVQVFDDVNAESEKILGRLTFTDNFNKNIERTIDTCQKLGQVENNGFTTNLGTVPVFPDEWQSPILMSRRFAVVGNLNELEDKRIAIWNDFNDASIVLASDINVSADRKSVYMTNIGAIELL